MVMGLKGKFASFAKSQNSELMLALDQLWKRSNNPVVENMPRSERGGSVLDLPPGRQLIVSVTHLGPYLCVEALPDECGNAAFRRRGSYFKFSHHVLLLAPWLDRTIS